MSTNPRVRQRTNAQREEQLIEIAELHLRGARQREIAAKFGLTQSQISRDLKEIYRRWAADKSVDLQLLRAKTLAELEDLKRTYRAGYEESRKPREIQTQERIESDETARHEGTDRSPAKARRKVSLRTEERTGNPVFLNGIRDCIDMACKLQGLYRPPETSRPGELESTIQIIKVTEARPPALPPPEPAPTTELTSKEEDSSQSAADPEVGKLKITVIPAKK